MLLEKCCATGLSENYWTTYNDGRHLQSDLYSVFTQREHLKDSWKFANDVFAFSFRSSRQSELNNFWQATRARVVANSKNCS